MKPHLACDLEEDKLKFPLIGMPKIDGIRGVNLDGTLKQRSLKPMGNQLVAQKYSGQEFLGFDGELAIANEPTAWDLCRRTMSATRSGKVGLPDLDWWLFDYLAPEVVHLPYKDRLIELANTYNLLRPMYESKGVKLMPWVWLESLDDYLIYETKWADEGYEGTIVRDPNGMHKDGRCTVKEGAYMRKKPWITFEGIVVSFTEAEENTNEAKTNELGRSERSTHKAGMVAKGMIGNITIKALADVVYAGRTLIVKDQLVVLGPGNMPHLDREFFFEHPEEFLGEIAQGKMFAHGQKDKPRTATFVTLRDVGDVILDS